MKCKRPTLKLCIGDPTQPIFHWLTLVFRLGGNANFMFLVGGNASFSVFRYQHVGISNTKFSRWGYYPTQTPNARGFALQWNIGFTQTMHSFLSIYHLLVAKECKSALTAKPTPQKFTSLGYPAGYPSNTECTWVVLPENRAAKTITLQVGHIHNKGFSIPRHLQGEECNHWPTRTSFGISSL